MLFQIFFLLCFGKIANVLISELSSDFCGFAKYWIGLFGFFIGFLIYACLFCKSSIKRYIVITGIISILHACEILTPNFIRAVGMKNSVMFFVERIFAIEIIAFVALLIRKLTGSVPNAAKIRAGEGENP